MRPRTPDGAALATVLAVLVGLLALTGGVLGFGLAALRSGRASGDALRARAAAEAGARSALAGAGRTVLPVDVRAVPPGSLLPALAAVVDGTARYSVTPHRVDGEFVLLESTGYVGFGGAIGRQGLVAWILDPPTRLRRAPAVLESAGTVRGLAGVQGHRVAIPPSGWPPGACATEQATVDSIFASGWVKPYQPVRSNGPPWEPSLGLLSLQDILAIAGPTLAATVTPGPSFVGPVCNRLDPANWGSPSSRAGPCGGYMPLVGRIGSLVVDGGEGQGILVVDGDLTLRSAAQFVGWVLVSGSLRLEGGAQIEGFVQTGGAVALTGGSRVIGAGCAALKALEAVPALRIPVAIDPGPWLEPM